MRDLGEGEEAGGGDAAGGGLAAQRGDAFLVVAVADEEQHGRGARAQHARVRIEEGGRELVVLVERRKHRRARAQPRARAREAAREGGAGRGAGGASWGARECVGVGGSEVEGLEVEEAVGPRARRLHS